jgi:hypothetical protein
MQEVHDFSTIAAGTRVGINVSEIPNAGRGLFTYNAVREGSTVGEYFGWRVEKDSDYSPHNTIVSSYSMGNHNDTHIYCAMLLGTRQIHCVAAYINDPLDDMQCNVRPIWNGPRCRIVTVRDIEPMEEFKMAYGDIFWMRDIFPLELLQKAWANYAVRRTLADWNAVIQRRIAIENEESEPESEEDQSEWEDEREVVFPVYTIREIIDLTQGDEPVIIREPVAVAQVEEPTFIPFTFDSPEYLEHLQNDTLVIRNSCA